VYVTLKFVDRNGREENTNTTVESYVGKRRKKEVEVIHTLHSLQLVEGPKLIFPVVWLSVTHEDIPAARTLVPTHTASVHIGCEKRKRRPAEPIYGQLS
jgi:hypothetical protein